MPPSASPDPRGRRFARRAGGLPVSQAVRPVFLFSGLGAEYPEMGRGLFRMSTTFRAELERCDRIYRELTGRPLLVRRTPPFGARLRSGRPSYVQPAVFAYQYALAAAWMAWGVRPAAVLGYSLGEDAAACIAGAASLDDVMALVVRRAQRMDHLGRGAMAALFAGADQTAAFISQHPGVEVAAVNGPEQTVVSGPSSAIDELLASAARAHIRARRVRIGCAFHSSRMDRILPALAQDAEAASFHEPSTPLLSSVTADWLGRPALTDPAYWSSRVRAPIRFRDGIVRLYAEGDRTFVELGPHPMLLPIVRRDPAAPAAIAIETARRGEDDARVTMAALSLLPRAGASLALMPAVRGRREAAADTFRRRRHHVEVSR
jgi:acyl transferase domain-containing protein